MKLSYNNKYEFYWQYIDDIDANLIPSDLYQSSDAPAAGSEDKTNCGGKNSTAKRMEQEETQ